MKTETFREEKSLCDEEKATPTPRTTFLYKLKWKMEFLEYASDEGI